ncbi:MAG: tyrosine-type recombinase/integrase [Vicinamibacterales bacterium]
MRTNLSPAPVNKPLIGSPGVTGALVPALFATAGERASTRFIEFFTVTIRNPNTRRAYAKAVTAFSDWCTANGARHLVDIEPVHVAAYVEQLQAYLAAPSVKQHLAAIRMLFDWLVVGQIVATNPAGSVRGPKHSVRQGKTPVLTAEETRTLLDSIDVTTLIGLRDRAIVALMTYTFARVGALLKMLGEDYYVQGKRGWVRLHEKGGKEHPMPCHHNLEAYLDAYITAAGIDNEKKLPLFRSALARSGRLTDRPLRQSDVYRMLRRRAMAAGIDTEICCHTFRATGITTYLKNGGQLELAQRMANHESARTTGLYDRRNDDVSLDEIERIQI